MDGRVVFAFNNIWTALLSIVYVYKLVFKNSDFEPISMETLLI